MKWLFLVGSYMVLVACGSGQSGKKEFEVRPGYDQRNNKPLMFFMESLTSDIQVESEQDFLKYSDRFLVNCSLRYTPQLLNKNMTITRKDNELAIDRVIEVIFYKVQLSAVFKDQDIRDVGVVNSEPWGEEVMIPRSTVEVVFAEDDRAYRDALGVAMRDFRYEDAPMYEETTESGQFRLRRFMENTEGCFKEKGDS